MSRSTEAFVTEVYDYAPPDPRILSVRLWPGDTLHIITGSVDTQGTVIEAHDFAIVLAVHLVGHDFEKGTLVELRHEVGGFNGGAHLQSVEKTSRFLLIHLVDITWQGKVPRAHRHKHEMSVTVDYYGDSDGVKRTIGQTIDMSESGARVRLRAPLKKGTVARLVVSFSDDRVVEALGRVVRIITGTESSGGGYEIGFHFERVIRGQEELMSNAPDEKSHSDDNFSFMDDALNDSGLHQKAA